MRRFKRALALVLVAMLLMAPGVGAHQQIPDYNHFCYYREVYHNQQPNGKYYQRSVRVATSQQLSSPYHWRLFYKEQQLNTLGPWEWWSDVHDFSCLSSRGYQP